MSRNTLKLDTSGMTILLKRLDEIGGDVEKTVTVALTKAGEKISKDTEAAMDKNNLPAKGKYSTGTTAKSIVKDAVVEWDGLVASIPVGFDFSLPGAGGFLITGTPKMQPNKVLNQMYKGKKYMADINSELTEAVLGAIVKEMEKGG